MYCKIWFSFFDKNIGTKHKTKIQFVGADPNEGQNLALKFKGNVYIFSKII